MAEDLAGTWLCASGTGPPSSLDLPTLMLGGDLRQRGAFVRDSVYFIPRPGLCFLFGFRRVACQY